MDAEGANPIESASTRIAPNLFDVFDIRPVVAAGRKPIRERLIHDHRRGARTCVARSESAARDIGRRVRFTQRGRDGALQLGTRVEIVGSCRHFRIRVRAPNSFSAPRPRLYQAAAPGDTPVSPVVRVKADDPVQCAERFRAITASVDPTLKLEQLQGVVIWWKHETQFFATLALVIVAVTASVLLLSAAGIYSR